MQINEINNVLLQSCFETELDNDTIIVPIGDASNPIPAILKITDNVLDITVQLSTFGDRDEETLGELAVQLLAMNVEVSPFAAAVLIDQNEIENSAIILIDSIPTENLQSEELISSMDSLNSALVTVGPAMVQMEVTV